jgi:hypothetical protein
MSAVQSRVRGIQRLHTAGLSYKTIATELRCSDTTIAEALHSTDFEFSPIKHDRKKIITPEISHYIKILLLIDSLLTNDQVKAKVQERWPHLEVSCNTIRDVRANLVFKFQPPMIKQDLSPGQRSSAKQARVGDAI